MTLLEQARQLTELAKRKRDRQVREGEAEKFRTRTQNLVNLVARLRKARAKWEALQRHGFGSSEIAAGPVKKLDSYTAVSSDETQPALRQADWESLVRALRTYADKLEASVGQLAEDAKANILEGASANELRGYAHDPATKAQADRLLGSFLTLSERNWKTVPETDIEALLQVGMRFREDFKAMQEQGASPTLRKFLALARSDAGAQLDALTDDVRSELAERGLLARMRLVIK